MDQRLKGQEVSVKIIQNGVVETSIDSISTFNDSVAFELKEQGYLGELVNRFDEIFNGFGGDFEFHVTRPDWHTLIQAILDRAQRKTPNTIFNVVRTDFYPSGASAIYTYSDVKWGENPTQVAGRGEYVKGRMQFKCSQRPVQVDSL